VTSLTNRNAKISAVLLYRISLRDIRFDSSTLSFEKVCTEIDLNRFRHCSILNTTEIQAVPSWTVGYFWTEKNKSFWNDFDDNSDLFENKKKSLFIKYRGENVLL